MKHRIGDRLLRFWAEDRGLSIFLVLLAAVVFILPVFSRLGAGLLLETSRLGAAVRRTDLPSAAGCATPLLAAIAQ
jgi:hypothetical protein